MHGQQNIKKPVCLWGDRSP